jgi:hypothetical protein
MKSFKDFIVSDLNTFINSGEFAEPHNIEGRILNVVVDNDKLQDRAKREYDGIYVGDILYMVKASDFGKMPTPGETQKFDRKICTIFDVRIDNGIYEVILKYGGS